LFNFDVMKYSCLLFFNLLLLFSLNSFAQDEEYTEEENTVSTGLETMKGFHVGFFAGAFFADDFSASIYNGRGIDENGNENSFAASHMYRKIIVENGGANGLPDNIAVALGVDHDQWSFDESDMPNDMKYNTAFMFGLIFNYGINKKEAIILNTNFAKLTATGNFSLSIKQRLSSGLQEDSIAYFGIKGEEQRLMFQLGYSRIVTNSESFNVFIEGGLCFNNAKYLNNKIYINELTLDLAPYDYVSGYTTPVNYTGWGIGAFAGAGFNLTLSSKYILQLVYNPSYEKINLGNSNASAKLQHGIGLRVYYNF
jgi:hypothetical protein